MEGLVVSNSNPSGISTFTSTFTAGSGPALVSVTVYDNCSPSLADSVAGELGSVFTSVNPVLVLVTLVADAYPDPA